MRAKYTRHAKRINPDYPHASNQREIAVQPGDEIEHPDAWRLVEVGMAVPADQECREKLQWTDEQIEAAQRAYDKTYYRIDPVDYKWFDEGKIKGYNPDGSYIPGPNWDPSLVEDDEAEDDDDE